MTAHDIVLAFIASLALCLRGLRKEFTGVSRDSATTPLMGRNAAGEGSRVGRIEGLGAYQFHGVGCRVEMDSGEEVNFDWDEAGDPVFDAWRLRGYAESLGVVDIAEPDFVVACRHLVGQGILEERPGLSFCVRP